MKREGKEQESADDEELDLDKLICEGQFSKRQRKSSCFARNALHITSLEMFDLQRYL